MKTIASVGPIFKGGELSERGSLDLCDYTKLPSTKAVLGPEVDHCLFCPGARRIKNSFFPFFLFFSLKSFLLSLKTENIDVLAKVMQKGHKPSPGAE